MPDYEFVDHPDNISQTISNHPQLGVDTEFMREKTYFAQLCLVQVATRDNIYCVDPLVTHDQAEFWTQLLDGSWVVHSARQDIEVVYQTRGAMPREIFDTQVAAGLLGMPAQLGYAGLVKDLFDVDMAKSHTRADWTRRPLSPDVLDYAAEVEVALAAVDAPMPARVFVLRTLTCAQQASTVEVLAFFLYGREDLIPEMFSRLLPRWRESRSARTFAYYVERHIQLDGDEHGPAAERALAELCGDDERAWQAARRAAELAIRARLAFWNGALALL